MDPVTAQLQFLLLRDLTAFQVELDAIPEDRLWVKPEGFPNAPGNLARHLAGNLQHFIGAVLNRSTYQRDREAEFAATEGTRAELQQALQAARQLIEQVLATLSAEELAQDFPVLIEGQRLCTQAVLLRLAVHLGYHLGQLNALQRMGTKA